MRAVLRISANHTPIAVRFFRVRNGNGYFVAVLCIHSLHICIWEEMNSHGGVTMSTNVSPTVAFGMATMGRCISPILAHFYICITANAHCSKQDICHSSCYTSIV